MLQTIRDRAQGWIAWVIVILLIIPFALWGIQSYLGVSGEPVAATVNGTDIKTRDLDRQVQQARIELRNRLGDSYDPALITDDVLRHEVLDNMIRNLLEADASRRLGLYVSDAQIKGQILKASQFQKDGRFDKETYERALRNMGMNPEMFEAQMRQQMAVSQLETAISGSEFTTTAELSGYQRLVGQKRELSYAVYPLANYRDDQPIADQQIADYYKQHTNDFQVPEEVKLDYILLDTSTLARTVSVSDDDLRRAYESEQARFSLPERRQVRHILIQVPKNADQKTADAALSKIKSIRQRILAGESFADVAKSESQDAESAAKGGSLGEVAPGVMDPAFEKAAFSLSPGVVSEPVRTPFGYHLIEVDKIEPASTLPFEEVRDRIHQELAKQKAESLYYDLAERLANLAYEMPDSLDPIAEKLGLQVQHTDSLSRSGDANGIFAQPKVMAAAFSSDVLEQGRNSDLIEPQKNDLQAVVVHVADHRPASVKPLADVHDEIVAKLRDEKARKAAQEAADKAEEQLRKGADWKEVVGTLKTTDPALVERTDAELPPSVLDVGFTLATPDQTHPTSFGTALLQDGDVALVRLGKVVDGSVDDPLDVKSSSSAAMLSQLRGRATYQEMLDDMLSRAKVKLKAQSKSAETSADTDSD